MSNARTLAFPDTDALKYGLETVFMQKNDK